MSKGAEASSVDDEMESKVAAALADVFFRHAHWLSAYEVSVQRLAEAITLGALDVGSQLPPERELVERLGVSRTTLREAIRALQQQGYVTTRRGRTGGTFVTSRQIRDPRGTDVRRITGELGSALGDLLDLRASVEPAVAELAAIRATDEQVALLRWLVERSRDAAVPDLRQTDSTLHIAIAHAADSDMLLDLVLEEQMRLHDLLAYLPFVQDRAGPVALQHASVVEAIARRDGTAARSAMEQHVAATNEGIRSVARPGAPAGTPT